ncbi:hypothetical protein D623_10008834 [Myotis brandtii]|uniref:Uncharacterized protein n=1 Tax=Myotis brandtii TaxID=109478 RepID=S7NQR0_MYOBR|nr:hypothetical protein D623_10008834 [Myotis brandtii]
MPPTELPGWTEEELCGGSSPGAELPSRCWCPRVRNGGRGRGPPLWSPRDLGMWTEPGPWPPRGTPPRPREGAYTLNLWNADHAVTQGLKPKPIFNVGAVIPGVPEDELQTPLPGRLAPPRPRLTEGPAEGGCPAQAPLNSGLP